MKYKHIDSALHNFGHSFVSLMNYVDDQYICDLLDELALNSGIGEARIDFSGDVASLPDGSTPALVKSFEHAKAWLPKLLAQQNVDPASLSAVILRYKLTRMGREVLIEAIDDRGQRLMLNILFVCGKNKWRSPTAEQVFSGHPGIQCASAGLSGDAEVPVSAELVDWAELILVMEKQHKSKLSAQFKPQLRGKRIVCLDIPDNFKFMEPALVKLLERKVMPLLGHNSS